MSLVPYLVEGIASGSVYSMAALGLVLTYKTSGVFNFAHGALACVGAAVFYELRQGAGAPWPIAAVLALVIVGFGGGLALETFGRTLAGVSTATRIVASVGLLLMLEGTVGIMVDRSDPAYKPFLPHDVVRLPGINLGVDQIITTALGVAALVALQVFFRTTTLGVEMRAVVESSELLGLTGSDPTRVRRAAWILGSTFATASGILLAATFGLDPTILTLLVVQAFGAGAVGGFTSLPLTYVGGLVLGIGSSVATKYVAQAPEIIGLPPSLPFIVLLLVLVIFPRRLPQAVVSAARTGSSTLSTSMRRPGQRQVLAAGAAVTGLAVIPFFSGVSTVLYTSSLITAMQLLSLSLLVRLSGQVSLCQGGFAAVGAASFAHFSHAGIPWLFAILLAALVAMPVGALVAIPAIRLSGVYLAIATFGFGVLLQRLVFPTSFMFGHLDAGLVAPRPGVADLDTDKGYYWTVLVFLIAAAALLLVIARTRLGRLLRAMGDSPTALSTGGTNVNITRVAVFCISSGLAALAGALSGPVIGRTSGAVFQPLGSLVLLAVLLICGRGLIAPCIVAAAAVSLPNLVPGLGFLAPYTIVFFGFGAMLIGATQRGRSSRPGPAGEASRPRRLAPLSARRMRPPVGLTS